MANRTYAEMANWEVMQLRDRHYDRLEMLNKCAGSLAKGVLYDPDPEERKLFRQILDNINFEAEFLLTVIDLLTLHLLGHSDIDARSNRCKCPICIEERGREWGMGKPQF